MNWLERELLVSTRCLCAAALVAVSVVSGCSPGTAKNDAADAAGAADNQDLNAELAAAQVSQIDEIVASLREANATLTRASNGTVTAVDLTGVPADDAMAEQISQLVNLTKLTLDPSSKLASGWSAIGKLNSLEHVDLRGVNVNNTQLTEALGNAKRLKSLRLNAQNGATTVDDLGLKVLAGCPDFKLLAADHLWVGAEGLEHIADPSKVVELYLAKSLVDDEALELIGKMTALRKLRIADTSVTKDGLAQIEDLPLVELDLSECGQIDDSAMEIIGKLTSLERLNLWRVPVTDEGIAQLANLTALQWLNLDATRLTDEGLPHLAGLKNLKFLHLGSTSISNSGLPKLEGLTQLRDLKVTRTAVTADGVAQLQAALPEVRIQLEYIEGK